MDHETNITQWADGALSGEALKDFEAAMAKDPGLKADAEAAREMHEILSGNLPANLDVPDSQAFNSGILDTIEEEKVTPFAAPAAPKAGRLPWVIAAAACVAAASTFLISPGDENEGDFRTAYTPDPSIDAKVYVNEEAGATIIILDGIAEIPDEQSITPKTLISRALPGGSGSRAFFAKHDDTSPSMVLTRTAGGQVRIQDVY